MKRISGGDRFEKVGSKLYIHSFFVAISKIVIATVLVNDHNEAYLAKYKCQIYTFTENDFIYHCYIVTFCCTRNTCKDILINNQFRRSLYI